MITLAVDLPFHLYGWVDKGFLSDEEAVGWEKAVLFALTVPANHAVGLTVLLENGAQYRALPPHAWAFAPNAAPWTLQQAQGWDCFGGHAQVVEYKYLQELPVSILKGPAKGEQGWYKFTLEWGGDGFSRNPEQSKSFHFLELENGRLSILPNDFLRWKESSFTDHTKDLSWIRRSSRSWGVE